LIWKLLRVAEQMNYSLCDVRGAESSHQTILADYWKTATASFATIVIKLKTLIYESYNRWHPESHESNLVAMI
jgi:hypothetical protein